jgi:hypothetical protein
MDKSLKPENNLSINDLKADLLKHKSAFLAADRSKNGTEQTLDLKFKSEVFDNLPGILKQGCDKLLEESEKQVFLFGALGIISGLLPNVRGFYDNKFYSPNLFIHLLGKYGIGKGGFMLCYLLGKPIHKAKRALYEEAIKEYNKQQLQYKKDLKAFMSNKKGISEPEEPTPPPQTLLYIPVNNSKSGFFQLLDENNGSGIMFETEGDTLVDAVKQDYGNYSDGLRKAFQHEPITFYRRLGREHREIENPNVSVIMCSTFDQFLHLIHDIHNGLFSRFGYFELESDRSFKNVFDPQKKDYPVFFENLGNQMEKYYNHLSDLENHLKFSLQETQQIEFLSNFQSWKNELAEYVTTDLDGTVHRLALICFRIAMILTTIRALDENELYEELFCSEIDFNTAISITNTLKANSLNIYYRFPDSYKINPENKFDEKAQKIVKAIELRKQELSYQQIADNLKESKTTVYRWLNSKK